MTDRITGIALPDDAVLTGEIAIICYINSQGGERWSASIGEGMPLSHVIGLLELAKHAWMSRDDDA